MSNIPTDPLGGKPPAGSMPSVPNLEYQVKYQNPNEGWLPGPSLGSSQTIIKDKEI